MIFLACLSRKGQGFCLMSRNEMHHQLRPYFSGEGGIRLGIHLFPSNYSWLLTSMSAISSQKKKTPFSFVCSSILFFFWPLLASIPGGFVPWKSCQVQWWFLLTLPFVLVRPSRDTKNWTIYFHYLRRMDGWHFATIFIEDRTKQYCSESNMIHKWNLGCGPPQSFLWWKECVLSTSNHTLLLVGCDLRQGIGEEFSWPYRQRRKS